MSVCLFYFFSREGFDHTPVLKAVAGIPYADDGLLNAGERIWSLERPFDPKAGLTREDDALPPMSHNSKEDQNARCDV